MSKALEKARKTKNKWSYHIRANSDAMNMADYFNQRDDYTLSGWVDTILEIIPKMHKTKAVE